MLLGQSNAHTLVDACRAAEDAGADSVKTSTGCPAGGATVCRRAGWPRRSARQGSKPAVDPAPPPTRSRCSTPKKSHLWLAQPGGCSMGLADS